MDATRKAKLISKKPPLGGPWQGSCTKPFPFAVDLAASIANRFGSTPNLFSLTLKPSGSAANPIRFSFNPNR